MENCGCCARLIYYGCRLARPKFSTFNYQFSILKKLLTNNKYYYIINSAVQPKTAGIERCLFFFLRRCPKEDVTCRRRSARAFFRGSKGRLLQGNHSVQNGTSEVFRMTGIKKQDIFSCGDLTVAEYVLRRFAKLFSEYFTLL